jgi:hypothetical protein
MVKDVVLVFGEVVETIVETITVGKKKGREAAQ